MAQLSKPSEDDKAWFDELLPSDPDVQRRPMFGQLAGFVNGNMFLCLFGSRVAVRLGDAQRAELLAVAGAEEFAPMPGRPMKEYVVLPPKWRGKGRDAQNAVERALAYARTLPPKPAKPAKPAKKPTA
jgi:TfoX/Sxy family transcriptional regulator of competence genes